MMNQIILLIKKKYFVSFYVLFNHATTDFGFEMEIDFTQAEQRTKASI